MANDADKMTALKELIGDDLLNQLLAGVATTEKDALAAGVAFKEHQMITAQNRDEWHAIMQVRAQKEAEALAAMTKAEGDAPPADEAMPEEAAVAEEEAESLFSAAELQSLATALAPLLVAAMAGTTKEATTIRLADVEGVQQALDAATQIAEKAVQDAAAAAATQTEAQKTIANLQTRLKELESDQPQGYRRPSQAPDNILTEAQAAQKQYTTPGKTALDTQVDFILNPSA